MKRSFAILMLAIVSTAPAWALIERSGNNPAFLVINMITNAHGSAQTSQPLEHNFSPETVDIGVDVGADGTVDYWFSDQTFEFLYRDARESVASAGDWRNFHFSLEQFAGETAKLVIVDNSDEYYIAIQAIHQNNADGVVVTPSLVNGDFEDGTTGWTVTGGSLTADQVITTDDLLTTYGTSFLNTQVTGNADTVTLESDEFVIEPIQSFVYMHLAGAASEPFLNLNVTGNDAETGSFVYLDLGTATEAPNGQYDEGTDVAVRYGFAGTIDNRINDSYVYLLNTSGLEGNQAQVVVVDNDETASINIDAVRMNYDNSIIPNGGFEEGVPREWGDSSDFPLSEHPTGGIPGWEVIGNDIAVGFNASGEGDLNAQKSGSANIGTALGGSDFRFETGIEIRSSVFTVTPIPAAEESVYLTFLSGQGLAEVGASSRAALELRVDTNNSGAYEEGTDFVYTMTNQGHAWARQNSSQDHVHFPRHRFYIDEAHQGMMGQIFVTDERTGGWDWGVADDFYFWNGSEAVLPFDNADFEEGPQDIFETITNWTVDNRNLDALRSSFAANQELIFGDNPNELAFHRAMNNRPLPQLQGDWLFDTADHGSDNGGPGGDGGNTSIESIMFEIPSLVTTEVADWALF